MGKKSRWMVRATLVLVLLSTVLPLYAAYWLQRPITSDSGRIRQDYQWSRTYAHAWANPDDILVENWAPQMCCQARIIYTNGNLADTDYPPTISPGIVDLLSAGKSRFTCRSCLLGEGYGQSSHHGHRERNTLWPILGFNLQRLQSVGEGASSDWLRQAGIPLACLFSIWR